MREVGPSLVDGPAQYPAELKARLGMAVTGGALALGSVWGGLVLAAMVDLPPSFFIVSLAVLAWVVVLASTGRRRAALPRPVDTHHPH